MNAALPDERGRFGPFGGRFVPETLMTALGELEEAYLQARDDPGFQQELSDLLRDYAGRPTPLYFASKLSQRPGPHRRSQDQQHAWSGPAGPATGQAPHHR